MYLLGFCGINLKYRNLNNSDTDQGGCPLGVGEISPHACGETEGDNFVIRIDIKDMQGKVKIDRRFLRRVVRETLKREGRAGEISIVMTDNNYIAELNRKYRSVDRETDVIAFPMDEEVLGDIVISVEKTEEQAKEYNQTFENELGRLVIHGILHLLGYDDVSRQAARRMRERQEEILKGVLPCR